MAKTIENKYIALFLLHALGDMLGSEIADWIDDPTQSISLVEEFIFIFIQKGGVNGIDIGDWKLSDNTLLHIAMTKTILKYDDKNILDQKFYDSLKQSMIDVYDDINIEFKNGNKRYINDYNFGYVGLFKENMDATKVPYNPLTNDDGSATRTLCIGAAFYKEEQLETLIELSINTSKLTHNSPSGFLAGFVTAYFASLAIRNVEIETWPSLLIKLLNSDKIKKYIDIENNDVFADYYNFIKYWKKYVDTRFINGKPMNNRLSTNMIARYKYYDANFNDNKRHHGKNGTFILEKRHLGETGYCCTIMAYDVLLYCDGIWEKLIFYGILHDGSGDTIGSIVGGLYGLKYGLGDVPESMLRGIEKKKKLKSLGIKFYNKFYDEK